MDIEMIWQICQMAFVISVAMVLIAMAVVMVFYRLSDEYKGRHRDRYFYDCSKDKWVRRKKGRKRK